MNRIPSILVDHNRLAPNWISLREVANPRSMINQITQMGFEVSLHSPRDLVAVNVLKKDRIIPRFYVPDVIIARAEAS